MKDDEATYGYLARFLNKFSCKWGGGIRIKKFSSMEQTKEEAKVSFISAERSFLVSSCAGYG